MWHAFVSLTELLLFGDATLGPILGLLLLLNRRDRRRAGLRQWGEGLVSRDLRDFVGIEVRCPVLLGGDVVAVDMQSCSWEEIQHAVERWACALSPGVRLLVKGKMNQGVPALVVVESAVRQPPALTPHPCCRAA
jgi:hypothetical protein